MSAAAVRLDGVAKQYRGGTLALAGVSLDVQPGSFVSLLGPSGCGKSTLLRLVAGLDTPSAGRVERPGDGQAIGFVFQEPTLMPWGTALANVALPLRLAGLRRADARARARAALARVDLAGFADSFPRALSGGMRMRVSIARALVTRPALLLMDEPFAALDEITRFKLNNDLLALWRAERFTVLFVTHSVFESVYLSQRVVIMAARPGRVTQDVAIEAPEPRGEAFRTSAGYAAQCRSVLAGLQATMAA